MSARRLALAGCALALLAAVTTAQAPRTHRLEVTPSTVAYGYYWADATPALKIASGDIIDVDTLLTNTPQGLERAGLAPDRVQASLRRIVTEVTGDKRGPGGTSSRDPCTSRARSLATCSR